MFHAAKQKGRSSVHSLEPAARAKVAVFGGDPPQITLVTWGILANAAGSNTVNSSLCMTILEKIPTVVTVAVLVGIFAGLKRHSHSARLQLWLVAWFLVFTHFVAQMFEPASGTSNAWLVALDLGSLQASAVAFVASVASVVDDRVKRSLMLTVTGVPSVAYAVLAAFDVHARWPFVVCLAAAIGAAIVFLTWVRKKPLWYVVSLAGLGVGVGAWAIRAACLGSFDEGLTALLGLGFGLPGILICRNYWRPSPGILTVAQASSAGARYFPSACCWNISRPR